MFRPRMLFARCNRFETRRRLCDKTSQSDVGNEKIKSWSKSNYHEGYKQLTNLNLITAAKMIFVDPPKPRTFGFDFHLVQFFFACMPSLAIYLVALYARSEMKRMNAELEEEMKEEEKEKAKELEQKKLEEQERYLPEISDVKARLEKLEVTIKDIAVQTKRQNDLDAKKKDEDVVKKNSMETDNSRPSTLVVTDESNQKNPSKTERGSVFASDPGKT